MELQERIEQEIAENPCLDKLENDPDLPDEPVEDDENPDAPTAEERELVVDETKNNEEDFERLLNLDEEWPDTFEERPRASQHADGGGGESQARCDRQHGRRGRKRCTIICAIS